MGGHDDAGTGNAVQRRHRRLDLGLEPVEIGSAGDRWQKDDGGGVAADRRGLDATGIDKIAAGLAFADRGQGSAQAVIHDQTPFAQLLGCRPHFAKRPAHRYVIWTGVWTKGRCRVRARR